MSLWCTVYGPLLQCYILLWGFAGRGRKNRGDEEGDDYSGQSRPSGPATIFDFLTDKIPASSKSTEPKG